MFARTPGDPKALIPLLSQQVSELNQNLPLFDVKTMQERLGDASARARFSAILLGIFASMAAVLAAIGIYGVMSYMVQQRMREMGIRVALGANSQKVIAQVVQSTAGLVIAGTALGLAGALAARRILATSLFEVKNTDPQTYALMTLILAVVALLACYIPVRRAGAVDPAITLRSE